MEVVEKAALKLCAGLSDGPGRFVPVVHWGRIPAVAAARTTNTGHQQSEALTGAQSQECSVRCVPGRSLEEGRGGIPAGTDEEHQPGDREERRELAGVVTSSVCDRRYSQTGNSLRTAKKRSEAAAAAAVAAATTAAAACQC